ncbi:MAG: LUD domain-containing protein [Acidobacteriota bacterium]
MSSRNAILEALRQNVPPPASLPAPITTIRYADPIKQFEETLIGAGGALVRGSGAQDLACELSKIEVYASAAKIASLVPGLPSRDVDLNAIQDPHELEGIDVAVIPGKFGVAENAAVWIPGEALGPHRAIFVIVQHLILVVPDSEIVHNLQQAYERLEWKPNSFGTFISGPSKTADIEQSLVIGAHGARSCTVILL